MAFLIKSEGYRFQRLLLTSCKGIHQVPHPLSSNYEREHFISRLDGKNTSVSYSAIVVREIFAKVKSSCENDLYCERHGTDCYLFPLYSVKPKPHYFDSAAHLAQAHVLVN